MTPNDRPTLRLFLSPAAKAMVILTVAAAIPFGFLRADPLPDPGEEGWDSEVFSLEADQQLAKIRKWIESSDAKGLTPAMVASWQILASDFTCTNLRPPRRTPRFQSEELTVWRMTSGTTASPSPPHAGSPGMAVAMNNLLEPFARAGNRQLGIKIYGLEIAEDDPSSVTTHLHVSLSGHSDEDRVEQHARWRVLWNRPGSGESSRIRHIDVEAFEETRATRKGGLPLFAETTAAVFRKSEAFAEQLAFSNAYWRYRIESHHVFDKFAHHGLAVGDADGDGLDDVYVCQPGGLPNRLFFHDRDGTVKDAPLDSGTRILDNTRSALFIDFDNDGDQDLVLAMAPGILFLENRGRGGKFNPIKVIPAVVDAYSLAAADYDLDGDLDIFACRYYPADADPLALPAPVPYFAAENGGANFLIRNDGGWKTSNATDITGLDSNNNRYSYAAIWIDYDNDGDEDIYVANDFGRNNLYRNDLKETGSVRFTDVAASLGLDDGAFGMSACGGDFDRDGHMDIYVGNMFSAAGSRVTRQPQFKPGISAPRRRQFQHLARGNTLFRNLKGSGFRNVSEETGIALGRWSWGSLFADINNDGWEDLIVNNGYITGREPDDL